MSHKVSMIEMRVSAYREREEEKDKMKERSHLAEFFLLFFLRGKKLRMAYVI